MWQFTKNTLQNKKDNKRENLSNIIILKIIRPECDCSRHTMSLLCLGVDLPRMTIQKNTEGASKKDPCFLYFSTINDLQYTVFVSMYTKNVFLVSFSSYHEIRPLWKYLVTLMSGGSDVWDLSGVYMESVALINNK